MDYITPDLYSTLADAYEITENFNREIDLAKKHNSASYMVNIRMDRLIKPLASSKQELEQWLLENKKKKELPKKQRGLSR